jgi:hypothetical protein
MTENLVKRRLIECALGKSFITYGELIADCKLQFDLALARDRKQFGEMLGSISKDEHAKGLPLLSSLVLDATKMIPGDGFFGMANGLGLIEETATKNERILFAHNEQMKCFKFWKQKKREHDNSAFLDSL